MSWRWRAHATAASVERSGWPALCQWSAQSQNNSAERVAVATVSRALAAAWWSNARPGADNPRVAARRTMSWRQSTDAALSVAPSPIASMLASSSASIAENSTCVGNWSTSWSNPTVLFLPSMATAWSTRSASGRRLATLVSTSVMSEGGAVYCSPVAIQKLTSSSMKYGLPPEVRTHQSTKPSSVLRPRLASRLDMCARAAVASRVDSSSMAKVSGSPHAVSRHFTREVHTIITDPCAVVAIVRNSAHDAESSQCTSSTTSSKGCSSAIASTRSTTAARVDVDSYSVSSQVMADVSSPDVCVIRLRQASVLGAHPAAPGNVCRRGTACTNAESGRFASWLPHETVQATAFLLRIQAENSRIRRLFPTPVGAEMYAALTFPLNVRVACAWS